MRLLALTLVAISCHGASVVPPRFDGDLTTQESTDAAKRMLRVRQPDQLVEAVIGVCGGSAWSIHPLTRSGPEGASSPAVFDGLDATPPDGVVLTHGGNGRTDDGVLYILPHRTRHDDGLPTRADVTLICDGNSETRRIWFARFDGVWKLYEMEVPGT
jgi:hypothetical protein